MKTQLFLLSSALALASLTGLAAQAPTPPPQPAPPAPFDQAKALEQLRVQIAGHEKEPAEAVYKNIKTLRGVPAGALLRVMEYGYSRSLGVSCVHCHTPTDWSSDEKTPKAITRRMADFSDDLNAKLRAIPELTGREPVVNCTTCHRGQLKPALNLDSPGKAAAEGTRPPD